MRKLKLNLDSKKFNLGDSKKDSIISNFTQPVMQFLNVDSFFIGDSIEDAKFIRDSRLFKSVNMRFKIFQKV